MDQAGTAAGAVVTIGAVSPAEEHDFAEQTIATYAAKLAEVMAERDAAQGRAIALERQLQLQRYLTQTLDALQQVTAPFAGARREFEDLEQHLAKEQVQEMTRNVEEMAHPLWMAPSALAATDSRWPRYRDPAVTARETVSVAQLGQAVCATGEDAPEPQAPLRINRLGIPHTPGVQPATPQAPLHRDVFEESYQGAPTDNSEQASPVATAAAAPQLPHVPDRFEPREYPDSAAALRQHAQGLDYAFDNFFLGDNGIWTGALIRTIDAQTAKGIHFGSASEHGLLDQVARFLKEEEAAGGGGVVPNEPVVSSEPAVSAPDNRFALYQAHLRGLARQHGWDDFIVREVPIFQIPHPISAWQAVLLQRPTASLGQLQVLFVNQDLQVVFEEDEQYLQRRSETRSLRYEPREERLYAGFLRDRAVQLGYDLELFVRDDGVWLVNLVDTQKRQGTSFTAAVEADALYQLAGLLYRLDSEARQAGGGA